MFIVLTIAVYAIYPLKWRAGSCREAAELTLLHGSWLSEIR